MASARAQSDDYQATIDAAVEEYAGGHWEEALALFHRAHALKPSARTLRGLGMASFETRRYADTIGFLSAAMTERERPLTQNQRHEVERLLARAQAFVIRLSLVVEPAAATLTVDGSPIAGGKQRAVVLDAGTHQVVATARGYETSVRAVQLSPGAVATLEIELSPKSDGPTPIAAPHASTTTPSADAAAPSTLNTTVASEPSQATRFGRLKYVALAATASGLLLTGVSAYVRNARARSVKQRCQDYAEGSVTEANCRELYESGLTWRRSAIAGAASTGTLLSLTLLLFALDKPRESSSARLLRACAIDAAPLRVRCGARF